jgi:hypothetical protein
MPRSDHAGRGRINFMNSGRLQQTLARKRPPGRFKKTQQQRILGPLRNGTGDSLESTRLRPRRSATSATLVPGNDEGNLE